MNMHRTLPMALIAVAAHTANAQSTVTIGGQLEVQVARQGTGTSAVSNFLPAGVRTRVDGLSSRLIFRGTEDLGGGMSAYFVLDHRFKPDTGAQSFPAFWDGQSILGLATPYGSVYGGRDYIPAFYPGVKIDPWSFDGSIGSIQGQSFAGYAVANGPRGPNAVGYRSPSMSGVTVHMQYSLGEGAILSTHGANIEYTSGPAYAGLAYSHTDENNRAYIVSGFYDFGIVKPAMWYAVSKRAGVEGRSIALAMTVPVGPGTLKAVYQVFDPDTNAGNKNAGTAAGGAERKKVALGWTYPLSKRTFITPTVAWGKQDFTGLTANNAFEVVLRHNF